MSQQKDIRGGEPLAANHENLEQPFPKLSNELHATNERMDDNNYRRDEHGRPHVLRGLRQEPSAQPAPPTKDKPFGKGSSVMFKYSLYESSTTFFLVGSNWTEQKYRLLRITKSVNADLDLSEDEKTYSKKEMNRLLDTLDDDHKSSGGLKNKYSAWGLLGFIRFTGPYYMLLVTKRSQVAMIGGHYIYQIDGTALVSLAPTAPSRGKSEKNPEEARFISILNNLDLTRSFYYSYSYDVTRTLQRNVARQKTAHKSDTGSDEDFNSMFAWNQHLLNPILKVLPTTLDWCLPIIHGYVDQSTLSVYGRSIYIIIIARRSRFFAGARFLKRGANDLGYVANDVETEQIVSEMLTTSFHAPGPRPYANPNYTSYVQHRGSIPLYWTQENTGVTPKPPIELNLVDPFYSAAALHFDDLFDRYGAPIYILNLVKSKERTPRESKLLKEFTNAVTYLNQFLPRDKKLIYRAWDMSRASKRRDQDVIGTLEHIAEDVVQKTGIFRNGDGETTQPTLQTGVARTNCIDCLDRTNAAQFVIGKCALAHQLHALGVISESSIAYDTDAVNLFTHMYHDHGDTIAIQYGGSHLVNTMETYRKINQWTSHSRDMVESFKRYYNNSFLDSQRQEAYNLFLGNYIFAQGQPMLWDLSTDYYLHHADPRSWLDNRRRSYIQWYTPEHLERKVRAEETNSRRLIVPKKPDFADDYWHEYYRPLALSSFMKVFAFRMNSTLRYMPLKSTQEGRYDLSPFRVRTTGENEHTEKKNNHRKTVTIAESHDDNSDDASSLKSFATTASKRTPIQRWFSSQPTEKPSTPDQFVESHEKVKFKDQPPKVKPLTQLDRFTPSDKTLTAQWTLDEFVDNSLHPTVTTGEETEYQKYISHPLHLPLVVSSNDPLPPHAGEYQRYVKSPDTQNSASPKALRGADPDNAGRLSAQRGYEDFLSVPDNPLMVSDADGASKRYKAYRRWLKGKSLFNQVIPQQ